MQETHNKTYSVRIHLSANYKNMQLWAHIQIRVRKRINEFLNFFRGKLSLNEEKLKDYGFDDFAFDFESLIIKQVYSMAIVDGLYTKRGGKKIDIKGEDKELDNLIELCFIYPTLLSSMLHKSSVKIIEIFDNYIQELKAQLYLENQARSGDKKIRLSEKELLENQIIEVIHKLTIQNPGKKISVSAIAAELGYYNEKAKKYVGKNRIGGLQTFIELTGKLSIDVKSLIKNK
jgi:hypothetical protein